jgi:excisionase family DNA binding protein
MNSDKLLTPEDVATMLGTSRLFVVRQARIRKIPGIKIGKVWRFRLSTLQLWLSDKENKSRMVHDSAIVDGCVSR